MRATNPRKFFSEAELSRINECVGKAELRSSAEVKVVICRHCWSDIKAKASKLFRRYGLDKTEQRNCVLIMLVVTNREFLIYGDEGIDGKVGQGFWDDVKGRMAEKFSRGEFAEGLCEAVELAGEKLGEYFPRDGGDVDEIENEVIFEK